jgi:hypothetical protein
MLFFVSSLRTQSCAVILRPARLAELASSQTREVRLQQYRGPNASYRDPSRKAEAHTCPLDLWHRREPVRYDFSIRVPAVRRLSNEYFPAAGLLRMYSLHSTDGGGILRDLRGS